jgi:oxygen-dependent protoporphyrinogen oxidase
MPAESGGVVAVVGSGASGLGAAYELERAGLRVELIERESTLGGRFGVSTLGNRPVMMGGKNIGRQYTTFRAFTSELGNNPYESFGFNASRLKGHKIVTIDSSRRARTLANIMMMGSPMDVIRLARLVRRIHSDEANRYLGSDLSAELGRKYDHDPISRHFSRRLTRNFLRPLTVRQTGAEPDEVYLGSLATNVGSLMDSYDQLQHEIQPVLEALAARVTVRLGARVDGLVVKNDATVGLLVSEDGAPPRECPYIGVVLATPAYVTREIVSSALPALSSHLGQVSYYPSTVVLVEYDRPVFTREVRALALDDGPCSNVGSYSKEERHIARYTFSGRGARLSDPSEVDVQQWVDTAEKRVARYLPIGDANRVQSRARHWAAAYCGYTPFHADFLRDVDASLSRMAGLELAGDYLRGVSIEACFRSGADAAARLSACLKGVSDPSRKEQNQVGVRQRARIRT